MAPRVFTIPASAPFLPTLIEALTSGKLGFAMPRDPLALASATLYLPTRRACRLAHDAFLDVLKADAALLPRIVPLGDIDEDEIAFAEAATGGLAADALALPEALGGLERRLLLTRLIESWARSSDLRGTIGAPLVAQTPAAACALADALARLIDDMTTRNVPWDKLNGLVPDEYDRYWQFTLRFLDIARKAWPDLLHAHRAMEPAARRDALIKAETARLAKHTDGPVIAAGSTGSIPSTAELIATIAGLSNGAVVLPGLDTDLDDESWQLIAGDPGKKIPPSPGHPQFALQALLTRIGIVRGAVEPLAPARGRERLVSEALRPALRTDLWRQQTIAAAFENETERALGTVTVIEAANAEEEALAIAVALREAVENGKTAALVTPDRGLSRRVLAALARWNIAAEDSGGDALADSPAGVFARLAAETALDGLEPVTLLALLKHALLRLDLGERNIALAALERAVLRGPRPNTGSRGLAAALQSIRAAIGSFRGGDRTELHWSDPRTELTNTELDAAADLVDRLSAALAPLESLGGGTHSLAEIANRHRDVLALLSRHDGKQAAFVGPDGAKLAEALDELAASESAADFEIAAADYVELFSAALADRVVRRPIRSGTRVRILGLLEARLTESDRVVLGSLVEGTWPPDSRNDAWLNRPMRLQLGLDLPERRIGLTAHDFAQMLGARDVFLTHAAKLAGAPTVQSRFVQRLAAVTGGRWKEAVARGSKYISWARDVDRPEGQPQPEPPPAPKPPRAVRPARLSVTEIEDWLRDPYTIYARHILKLRPLDAIGAEPGAAERGTFIHAAIGDFTAQFANELPADPEAALMKLGRSHFMALEKYPEARAFWWPRFERIARWFAAWERERRPGLREVLAEIRGEIEIPLTHGVFRLNGRADRIERNADGSYSIFDYKTGTARSGKQVESGLAPQLTLEAAILRRGGFKDIAEMSSVAQLGYVLLKGGDPAGEPKPLKLESAPDDLAEEALEKLKEVARKFEDEDMAYRSLVHPMWSDHYGDYDHLARVKEWSSGGGGGGGRDSGNGA
jgi:ATP-dependent helicase/nuclease subunit B